MMASNYIIDVSEADFEYQVLAYSQQVPVIVDFWAEWCGPCKVLGPMLEQLAEDAKGSFRLARVDVDNNPNLAMRYNVRSIPTVKAFKDGKVVSEFVGAQPEPRLREMIKNLAPSGNDLLLEKANSMARMGQWKSAEEAFRQVLAETPGQTAALLGLSKSLLIQGYTLESTEILQDFPSSREYSAAEKLLPLSRAIKRMTNDEVANDDPLEATYRRALRLVTRGNLPAALDGLLDVLRQDKHYRSGEVRLAVLGIFELIGEDDPLTRQYRQELANILF